MSWMRGLSLMLFMRCRDAAPLISYAMDRAPAAPDRRALRVHLSICRSCRRYRAQLNLIRGVLLLSADRLPGPTAEPLSGEARTRIRFGLERGVGGN